MWIRLWIIVLYFCLFLLLSFWKVKIVLDSVNWIWQLESFHLAQDLCSFTRNCNAFHTICQTSFEISHYIWNYNAFHTIYQIDISYCAWKCNAFRISYQIQFRIFHSIWNCNACQTLNQTWFEIFTPTSSATPPRPNHIISTCTIAILITIVDRVITSYRLPERTI